MSRVLVISDQPVMQGGFQQVLHSRGFDVAVCDHPSSPVPGLPPDLVLIDLTAGLTLDDLAPIGGALPACPVVLWSESLPLDMVFRALECGVRGIVERSSPPDHLADSLRRVAAGEIRIGLVAAGSQSPPHHPALTPREREIIGFLREGMRNRRIAAEMHITEGTVKIYLFRLFQKLGVRNRFELARYGERNPMRAA